MMHRDEENDEKDVKRATKVWPGSFTRQNELMNPVGEHGIIPVLYIYSRTIRGIHSVSMSGSACVRPDGIRISRR